MDIDNIKIVKPHVELLAYTQFVPGLFEENQKPENLVAGAAKLCYSSSNVSDLLDQMNDEVAENFLSKLPLGHKSPMEHISFSFGIEGITRSCSHQIVRHRIASYSQQSQRYVNLKEHFAVVVPPEIEKDEKLKKLFLETCLKEYESYVTLTEELQSGYEKQGMKSKAAEKKAIEDAREVLPTACETKLMMTMNASSLNHFFHQRCCNRAQWQIRDVANQMLDLVFPLAPTIFRNAGAPCVSGPCPEGKMTCGNPQKKKVLK